MPDLRLPCDFRAAVALRSRAADLHAIILDHLNVAHAGIAVRELKGCVAARLPYHTGGNGQRAGSQ